MQTRVATSALALDVPIRDVVQSGDIFDRRREPARRAALGYLGNTVADAYAKNQAEAIEHGGVKNSANRKRMYCNRCAIGRYHGRMQNKPYSAACDRNRVPILGALRDQLASCRRVLEIGSGTGQHAVYFGAALTQLVWQTSDVTDNHEGIRCWLADEGTSNVLPPLDLNVSDPWPDMQFDAVFSANTLHIMGWQDVCNLFAALPGVLAPQARVVIYGPFHYDGQPTSQSNARFDAQLRGQAGDMGIRDARAINDLAGNAGLARVDDIAMPANNRCLVWRRV